MSQRLKANFNQNSEIEKLSSSQEIANSETEEIESKQEKRPRRITYPIHGLGIICALLCAVSYSTICFMVKLVDDVHPLQMSVSRCCVQFLIILPILQYKGNEVDVLGPEGLSGYLWLRAMLGCGAMVLEYQAVAVMSVGSAVTISYTSTIMTPIIARIFLKESLTVFDLIFAMVSLCGVVLIVQPTFLFPLPDGQQPAAFLQSVSFVVLRKLGRGIYPALNVFYHSICGAVAVTVLLTVIGEWSLPCLRDLPYVFSLGILGVIGQYGLVVALHIERAGTIGVLISTEIIIIYSFQILALGDYPNMLSLIGATIVFSTGVGIRIRKIVNETVKGRKSIASGKSISKK